MAADKAQEIKAARKNELSCVAEDQNWRSYVANELKCQDIWQQDWGFLAGGSDSKKQAKHKIVDFNFVFFFRG